MEYFSVLFEGDAASSFSTTFGVGVFPFPLRAFGAPLHGCHSVWGVLFAAYYVRSAMWSMVAYTLVCCHVEPLIRFLLGGNHLCLGLPVRSNTRHMYQAVQTMKRTLTKIYLQISWPLKWAFIISNWFALTEPFTPGGCEAEGSFGILSVSDKHRSSAAARKYILPDFCWWGRLHGHTPLCALSTSLSKTCTQTNTLPSPHELRLLCFCWQGAFVLLLGSTGVGMHYVIHGVCLGYTENQRERDEEGCDYSNTHTHTHIWWHNLLPSSVARLCPPLLRAFPASHRDFWEPRNILFHPPLTFVQSRTKLLPLVSRTGLAL